MDDNELLKQIAKNIQAERKNLGYSQEEFAEHIDKSWSYVSKWETGKNNFTLKTINKIASLLNVPVSKLFRLD